MLECWFTRRPLPLTFMHRPLFTACVLALAMSLPSRPSAQTMPPQFLDLADAASAVVTGRVESVVARQDARAIYTYVSLRVSRVLKGNVADGTIVVKQLGGALPGLRLWVPDQPSWTAGEEVLLFLSVRPRDGTLTTTGLSRGKWLLLPDLQTGSPVAVNGAARVTMNDTLSAVVAGAPLQTQSFTTAPSELADPSPSFTFISGGPARWHEVDDGATVTVDYQSNTDTAVFNAAIGGWNGVGSRMQLRAGPAFTAPTTGCTDFRDRAAIAFFWDDPCREVPDDGVTMGYGGGYYSPGLQKTINGVTFDRYLEGFAILNQGEPLTSRPNCRTDAALHVMGHAIGLGDSDASDSVMWRMLRASCTGLAQDDRDGIRFIYPAIPSGGRPPDPPTAITSSVILDTVTLSWSPATTGGPAQSYTIEARYTPTGPVIATLNTTNATPSLVVGGVQSGSYFVRVQARNALGTSAFSPGTTVVVGPCTAPSAPTGLAYTTADNLVTLNWTPPASGVTQGYWLYAGTAPDQSNALVAPLGPTPSFFGPAVYGTYYVRLAARNSCAVGPTSAELTVVVAPCTVRPNAPTGLTFTRDGNVVTLNWSAPASGNLPSRYVILAGSARGLADLLAMETTSPATRFAASAPPGRYFVRVLSRNNCGDSLGASNELEIVIP